MNPDKFMSDIGAVLAELRESRGLSQNGLAEASEVDQTTIAKVETGTHLMRLPALLRVCRALGIQPSDLFRAAESRQKQPPGRTVAALDPDESNLVTVYQCCSAEGRKILMDRARASLQLFPRR